MPSKYHPQLFGWISDLDKGPRYVCPTDDRLMYANDHYCVFIRKILSDQLFYLVLSFVCILLGLFLLIFLYPLLEYLFQQNRNGEFIFLIFVLFVICLALYIVTPEFYQNLFTRKGSPIIFNRHTQKVYVNESYFFNFKFWRNPLTFLFPAKRRVKEYDWADLQGVVIHNYSRYALTTTILMVCKPGTNQTIDHIMLDPARTGVGSTYVWGWVNSFMSYYRSAGLNDGKYLSAQEDEFKDAYIKGQRWPTWMVEAFNAESLEQLTQIKQKYNVTK